MRGKISLNSIVFYICSLAIRLKCNFCFSYNSWFLKKTRHVHVSLNAQPDFMCAFKLLIVFSAVISKTDEISGCQETFIYLITVVNSFCVGSLHALCLHFWGVTYFFLSYKHTHTDYRFPQQITSDLIFALIWWFHKLLLFQTQNYFSLQITHEMVITEHIFPHYLLDFIWSELSKLVISKTKYCESLSGCWNTEYIPCISYIYPSFFPLLLFIHWVSTT